MSKLKIVFKNDKKVIGRTSKKYPKQLQTDKLFMVLKLNQVP